MSFKKYSAKGNAKQVVKNPSLKQLKQKEKDSKRGPKNRDYINAEIERRGCCEFCGIVRDPKVYQWHHIDDEDPDKKSISELSSRASFARLDAEFRKCVLLCPTCHNTFHQDLCCMFEHKQQHIDGTFTKPKQEPDSKPIVYSNSLLKFL